MKYNDYHKRLNHEPPAAIAERGWRYHHLGIPYTEPRPEEKHYEHLKNICFWLRYKPLWNRMDEI